MGLFRKDEYDKGRKALKNDNFEEAINHWLKGVEKGNVYCMLSLGFLYSNPSYKMLNAELAFKYYLMAAEKGDANALMHAGECLAYGKGTKKDSVKGLEFLRMAERKGKYHAKTIADKVESYLEKIRKGDNMTGAEAYGVALSYIKGEGTEEDHDLAFEMIKKAAEKGHIPAIKDLGDFYLKGVKVEKNVSEAHRLYKIAAEQEFGPAQYMLAAFYFNGVEVPKDMAEGLKLLKKAADNGYDEAQLMLGTMYISGQDIPKNQELGFHYVELAADQDNKKAKLHLGHYYYYGIGTEKDYDKAETYLVLAHAGGEMEASLVLGYLKIFHSKGTKQDQIKGYNYFRDAEKANLPGANMAIAYCYDRGIGTIKYPDEAIRYYKKGLEDPRTQPQEYISACNNLGLLYSKGKEYGLDIKKAIFYFQEATKRGDYIAPLNLGLLYYKGVKESGRELLAKDDSIAYLYLKMAAERGNKTATRFLKPDLSGLLPRYQVGLGDKLSDIFEEISSEIFENIIKNI